MQLSYILMPMIGALCSLIGFYLGRAQVFRIPSAAYLPVSQVQKIYGEITARYTTMLNGVARDGKVESERAIGVLRLAAKDAALTVAEQQDALLDKQGSLLAAIMR